MDIDRERRVLKSLEEALALAQDERASFLTQLGAHDPSLRRDVEARLAIDTNQATPQPFARPRHVDREGAHVGVYRIIRELGRGGMGAVYLGEREDKRPRRQVAIKILKRGMDSEQIVRRFYHEQQILANLDHPNIARLYDGGTTDDGLPYFVMEYVAGESIHAYSEKHALSVRARLLLFQKVCAAVHFAHRNLIIHRDLKPGNILITPEGEPKLLDFGIAKLLGSGGDPAPETISRMMTPGYASPEQLRGMATTTASDVYSLGVILYELMTGLRFSVWGHPEKGAANRLIREIRPVKPSDAVINAWSAKQTAGTRGDAHKVARGLAGDIDNIVLMALAPEPDRRYGSVEQFSEDIHRLLTGHSVRARKTTLAYITGKFLKRHRLGLCVAFFFGVLVITSTSLYLTHRHSAFLQRERADQLTRFMLRIFDSNDPLNTQKDSVSSKKVLDEAVAWIETHLQDQPADRAKMTNAIGSIYTNIGSLDRAEQLLAQALTVRRRLLGPDHVEVAETLFNIAELEYLKGRFAEAADHFQEVLEIQEKSWAAEDPRLAAAVEGLGRSFFSMGDYVKAESHLNKAIQLFQRGDHASAKLHADCLANLGATKAAQGQLSTAKSFLERALAIQESSVGPNHPFVARILNNLGAVCSSSGDLASSEKHYVRALVISEAALGANHPYLGTTYNNLAVVLEKTGQFEEAADMFQKSLEIAERELGADHFKLAFPLNGLAKNQMKRGSFYEAEQILFRALSITEKALGPEHRSVSMTLMNLSQLYLLQDRFEEAEQYCLRALQIREKALGHGHPRIAESLILYAEILQESGRIAEAGEFKQRAMAIQAKK